MTETFVGTITTIFEFDQDSDVIDLLSDGYGDPDERKRWNGKTLENISEEDRELVFVYVYRASIDEPKNIEFSVDIENDER
jgi:hypothetical protein